MRVCRTPNNDEKKNTDKKIIATKFNLLLYFAFIYSSLKLNKIIYIQSDESKRDDKKCKAKIEKKKGRENNNKILRAAC